MHSKPTCLPSKLELRNKSNFGSGQRRREERRMGGRSSESSSGEEDGDADWKAKINSVASSSAFSSLKNGSSTFSNNPTNRNHAEDDDNHDNGYHTHKPQQLKHYQVKVSGFKNLITDKFSRLFSLSLFLVYGRLCS